MKKLLATLLILCAGPVWAEWVEYAKSEYGDRHYFDPSTVKGGGGIKRGWTKVELATKASNDWLSARALEDFDCPNDRQRILQLDTFFQPNLKQFKESFSGPTDWEYVPPGTVKTILFKKVCGKK